MWLITIKRRKREEEECEWKIKEEENTTYLSVPSKHFTSIGRMPDWMRSSIGGFLSDDSSLRAACTAANCTIWSSLAAFSTISAKLAAVSCLSASSSSEEERETDQMIFFSLTNYLYIDKD